MAITFAPFTVSPASTQRSFTIAERRVGDIRTEDNEKYILAAAFCPPGKTKRKPGGRVGSSSWACTVIDAKEIINVNKLNNNVFSLNTNPTLMKT